MDLEQQAQEMAEKALASLPPAARAAKLETVKAGILKRLQATQAAASPPPPPAVAPPPPEPEPPADDATLSDLSAPLGVPGVELFGDLPWFADLKLRGRLLQEVRQAHAAEKILVGAPAEEIQRILSRKGGQLLAAGAVLRLGGVHHGGYSESDVNYAYRQLSRALHPDKNPGIPEAHDSFKRLGEAAEELKQVLAESRLALNSLCQATLGAAAAQESLERPQGELMAEASRLLAAVLSVSGEGTISETALWRAPRIFVLQTGLWRCQPQDLLAKWYQEPKLLELFASSPLRIAYDCAKKRFRAQFLCALSRAAEAEARRNDSCVRGSWQKVLTNFPELSLWKALQDKIRSRVWASGAAAAGKRSRMSKWDDKSAASSTTDWGKKWRAVVKAVLPKDGNGGVTCSDPEVQKLCLAMWRDLSSWAAEECRQHLMLFQADEQGDAEETQWAFVPATDLLLLVGEGLVGCAAEGFAVQADEGHTRIGFVDALKNWRSSLRKNRSAGKETSDSAVKLWQAAKREAQKMDKEEENKESNESKERNGHESGSKKSKTCDEPEEIKLNRSPTKVLLLTNLVPPTLEEDEIQSIAEKLVEDFGKIHECKILKVADVPEEDAVRVFLLFDSVQVSSKAYTALKGQVREGRALRARFYDERRFQDGDLQRKSVPSRVVLLSGLVNLEELDGGLKDEVISLAEKAAGRPLKCVIQTTELPGDEAVRVFLDFETVDDAVKAVSQLHGQEFGLRRIRARYSSEELKPQSSRGAERN